jgi:hypothetical protein
MVIASEHMFTIFKGEEKTTSDVGEGVYLAYALYRLAERGHNIDSFIADKGGINKFTSLINPRYGTVGAAQLRGLNMDDVMVPEDAIDEIIKHFPNSGTEIPIFAKAHAFSGWNSVAFEAALWTNNFALLHWFRTLKPRVDPWHGNASLQLRMEKIIHDTFPARAKDKAAFLLLIPTFMHMAEFAYSQETEWSKPMHCIASLAITILVFGITTVVRACLHAILTLNGI